MEQRTATVAKWNRIILHFYGMDIGRRSVLGSHWGYEKSIDTRRFRYGWLEQRSFRPTFLEN